MIRANSSRSNKEFLFGFKNVRVVVLGGLSSQQERTVETIRSVGDAKVDTEKKLCRSGRRGGRRCREPSSGALWGDQPPCGTASVLPPEVLQFGDDLRASSVVTPASGAFRGHGH